MLHTIASIMGYVASLLLAISLMVNNDLKFRWLNTFGCLSFIVYGVLINAMPVILTNSLLLLINMVYLVKLYRAVEKFDLIEFNGNEGLVKKFLQFHHDDIQNYYPGFTSNSEPGYLRFVVLRDLVIANMFVAKIDEQGNAEVMMNYTVPKYRDYKVGKFIFDREKKFMLSKGVSQVIYRTVANKKHLEFLKVMGFRETETGSGKCFIKHIS